MFSFDVDTSFLRACLRLFRNKNDLTDQLNKFKFGARLEPAMSKLVISDEATSHLSGRVNWHGLRIWGGENPRESFEHERDSSNVNVFAAMSREKLYGSFIFIERTVTGIIYLDMLREWLMPQLQEGIPDIPTTLHQQDTYQRGLCKYWSGIFHNVWQEVGYRFAVAWANPGAHIELY
jgi:hypothetical protein